MNVMAVSSARLPINRCLSVVASDRNFGGSENRTYRSEKHGGLPKEGLHQEMGSLRGVCPAMRRKSMTGYIPSLII
jgi:hypothetical protein